MNEEKNIINYLKDFTDRRSTDNLINIQIKSASNNVILSNFDDIYTYIKNNRGPWVLLGPAKSGKTNLLLYLRYRFAREYIKKIDHQALGDQIRKLIEYFLNREIFIPLYCNNENIIKYMNTINERYGFKVNYTKAIILFDSLQGYLKENTAFLYENKNDFHRLIVACKKTHYHKLEGFEELEILPMGKKQVEEFSHKYKIPISEEIFENLGIEPTFEILNDLEIINEMFSRITFH